MPEGPDAKPVTGAALQSLTGWELRRLVMRLAKDLPAEKLQSLIRIVKHEYRQLQRTEKGPER